MVRLRSCLRRGRGAAAHLVAKIRRSSRQFEAELRYAGTHRQAPKDAV